MPVIEPNTKSASTPHDFHRGGRALTVVVTFMVVMLLVAAGLAWRVMGASSSENPPSQPSASASDYFTLKRSSFDLTITSTGELVARDNIEIKCEVEGTSTILEVVPEGTSVKAGDVLVRFADDEVKEKLQQEELSTEQSRADFTSAKEKYAVAQSEADSKRKAAEVKLTLAKLDLAKWENGDDPQQQRDNQLALEKAQRTLERAKRDLELSKQLYEENFISLSEKEDDEIALIEAQNALETAKLAIEVYTHYTQPKERSKYTSDVDQAQAELDRTLRTNTISVETARTDTESKKRALEIREDRLKNLKHQLESTVIKAPSDGLVVYATSQGSSRWRRDDPITQGRQVRQNETIIYLPDTSKMVAEIKVHEVMLPQVKVGQQVAVNVDAQPGRPITGTISFIGVMAEDAGWLNPDLREYKVRVDLEDASDRNLKPGMRCTGIIMVGHVEDALTVPIQAVYTEGRERFCYVPSSGGRVRKAPVKIGRSSDTYVEIKDGLQPGDRVLLRKPHPGELE